MLLLFVAAAISNVQFDAHADECRLPKAKDSLEALFDSAQGALRPEIPEDLHAFCEEQVFAGVANLVAGWSPEQAEALRKDPGTKIHELNVAGLWGVSVFPSEATARIVYAGYPYAFDSNGPRTSQLGGPPEVKRYLEESAGKRLEASKWKSELDAKIAQGFDPFMSSSSLPSEISRAEKAALCAELTLRASACAEAMGRMERLAIGAGGTMMAGAYRDLLTNPALVDGARRAALKLMSKADSGGAPSGNLFDDLRDSFRESGLSDAEAKEATWLLLAVISTGGPNMSNRLESLDAFHHNPVTSLALTAIARALPILDVRSASQGRLYSYPSAVTATCNQGKPYHFWMSAYLARETAKVTGEVRAAAAAAYTLAKGYQYASGKGNREPERAFRVEGFDPFNNVIRMDLSYAAAGATFGARSVSSPSAEPLNVDQGFREMMNRGRAFEPLSESKSYELMSDHPIRSYVRWSATFAPDVVFRYFNSDQSFQYPQF